MKKLPVFNVSCGKSECGVKCKNKTRKTINVATMTKKQRDKSDKGFYEEIIKERGVF